MTPFSSRGAARPHAKSVPLCAESAHPRDAGDRVRAPLVEPGTPGLAHRRNQGALRGVQSSRVAYAEPSRALRRKGPAVHLGGLVRRDRIVANPIAGAQPERSQSNRQASSHRATRPRSSRCCELQRIQDGGNRRGRELLGNERLTRPVKSHQVAALRPDAADVMDGQGEVQAGAPAYRIRMPRVLVSGGRHAPRRPRRQPPESLLPGCPAVWGPPAVRRDQDRPGPCPDRAEADAEPRQRPGRARPPA